MPSRVFCCDSLVSPCLCLDRTPYTATTDHSCSRNLVVKLYTLILQKDFPVAIPSVTLVPRIALDTERLVQLAPGTGTS